MILNLLSIYVHKKKKNKHDFNCRNPKIIDYECNWNKRLILEMLNVKSNVNAINKKDDMYRRLVMCNTL